MPGSIAGSAGALACGAALCSVSADTGAGASPPCSIPSQSIIVRVEQGREDMDHAGASLCRQVLTNQPRPVCLAALAAIPFGNQQAPHGRRVMPLANHTAPSLVINPAHK